MSGFGQSNKKWIGRLVRPIHWLAYRLNLDVLFMHDAKKLQEHIISRLIEPICYHRDQVGDDRCWFDDIWLYWHLPESVRKPVKLTTDRMAIFCAHFHHCRGGSSAPKNASKGANTDDAPKNASQYLQAMTLRELRRELLKLRKGIRKHKSKGMLARTIKDDQELYALLPNGIEADFRLPPVEMFLPNCALICGMQDTQNVDLSSWPDGMESPLAHWRPG